MKLSLLFFFTLVMSSAAYPACNVSSARDVQRMLSSMGSWRELDGTIIFKWGAEWDDLATPERLNMITTFADSDACLQGRPRRIDFYRKGKLVGRASPDSGIRLTD